MKAAVLVKTGKSNTAFEIREVPKPQAKEGQVLIKAEGFGLNFADVMARLGQYPDAPPLPSILGYEVVGRVEGSGERVVGFTRFGGYGEYAVTSVDAIAKIPDDMPLAVAAALATQYCTAWFCAEERVRLFEGDRVLVHAAAGGVGTALVQMAKRRKCVIFGTAGSDEKCAHIKKLGVDHAINYNKEDFAEAVTRILGPNDSLDVIFDSIGGTTFRKGLKLLGGGGRIVGYGAAEGASHSQFVGMLKLGIGFGITHPALLLMKSKAVIGVNMLQIADHKPQALKRCLDAVTDLAARGELSPVSGGEYPVDQLAQAHDLLEHRKTVGKIAIRW